MMAILGGDNGKRDSDERDNNGGGYGQERELEAAIEEWRDNEKRNSDEMDNNGGGYGQERESEAAMEEWRQ
ncbi:hypothetical protein U1Q18_013897 [Sarracenia purpurea var. burkii]